MRAHLEKASGRSLCRGKNCKRLPEFVNEEGKILKGASCAAISISGAAGSVTAYYCEDCIEDVIDTLKKELDPNLRAFK